MAAPQGSRVCCSSLAGVVQFQRSVLRVTGCHLGTGDKAGTVSLRHRGQEGSSGPSIPLCLWEKWKKKGVVTGGTGAGTVPWLRGGLCRALGTAVTGPQESVCALPALPAGRILNPAPILVPAEGTGGLQEVTNPVLCIRAKPPSWPWRSPQPPPTMALSGCNLCGASSVVLGRPGSCKCHLMPPPPMAP